MKFSSVARFATSKIGVLALAEILVLGTASTAAAQNNGKGNGNGSNPFDAIWVAIEGIQEQIDELAANSTSQDDIDVLEQQVADLQGQVDELNERIAILEANQIEDFGDCDAPRGPGVDWHNCRLAGANLSGADLFNANLTGADLIFANLDCFNHHVCN